jgi:hypothetical protein
MNPENVLPHRFKKGRSGNLRGRPIETWREWLNSDRVEPVLREQLLSIALDRRVRVETRARVLMYLNDHAHGRAKETVQMDNAVPGLPDMPTALLEGMLEMRRELIDKREKPPALPQDRDGKEKS